MFNLLRSDCYRLVHSRRFWVAGVAVVLICIGVPLSVYLVMVYGDAESELDMVEMASRTLTSHSSALTYIAIFKSGTIPTVVAIMAALSLAEDFDSRFVTTLLAGRRDRSGYYLAKFVMVALMAVWYSMLAIVTLELTLVAFGFRYAEPEGLGVYLAFVGLNVLGVMAFASLAAAATLIARSKAFGVAMAVMGGTELIGVTVLGLASMLSGAAPWVGQAATWLPTYAINLLTDGRALAATVGSTGIVAADPPLGMPIWVHALVCFLGWIALACGATLLANRRRDLC